jgi:hypothetical protein
MIQLQIDTKTMIAEIDHKIAGIKELTSPSVLQEIAKATFTITGNRFVKDLDNYARRNPKKMHHVYEWGNIGNPNSRLFVLERSSILNGNLSVNTNFLPSKLPVPISPALLTPGKTGKVVSKRNIFKNKAEVMEKGSKVSFVAKRILAFADSEGIAFIAKGKTININHPGGLQTKNSFATYMLDWYTKNGNIVMDASGFYEKIQIETENVLNTTGSGAIQVRKAVARAAEAAGQGKVEII